VKTLKQYREYIKKAQNSKASSVTDKELFEYKQMATALMILNSGAATSIVNSLWPKDKK